MSKFLKIFPALFLLLVVSFSCSKADTFTVKLTVIDYATKKPKAGVTVESTALSNTLTKEFLADVEQTQVTDATGELVFEFEHEAKIHFEYEIASEKKSGATDVKLIPNETVEKTVYIYKFD